MPRTTSPTATAGTATDTDAATAATTRASVDSLPWEELVTSALLGTDRRPPTPRGGPVPADAPAALLDAAALHTVRQRAGLLPAVPEARPEPAAPDPRPALPEAARRRLCLLYTSLMARG
ncbi:DUF5691 domain-containing protein, partial [Streptomyces sp. rh34]|uniref:DUF5691 domain-containing protein n=1 Tax=Streptomyces sp. rh34 TaxID=2034272 RepID=UPI003F8F1F2C